MTFSSLLHALKRGKSIGSTSSPPVPLPSGFDEHEIRRLLDGVRVEGAPEAEMHNYCNEDCPRFLYTWGLVRDLTGACLELGSNPYFTTHLLQRFTSLEVTCCNYFGVGNEDICAQRLSYLDPHTGELRLKEVRFHNFNIEGADFPFADASFDVVLFCEILEHLQNDPCAVLLEIKRVLKPEGRLILTTPNVARLENIARMIAGANLYDPYSGYGPYGRHNREYNRHEIHLLMRWSGFEIETMFTADVHEERSGNYCEVPAGLLAGPRKQDLGQYIFARARSYGPARSLRPAWLYRSLPESELE